MLLTKVKIYQLICVDTFLGQCSILRFKFFTQYDLTTELWYFISLPPGHNNMYNIISPTSVLLSATGTLAFKNCGLSDEVSTFTPPELLQGRASSTKPAIERVRETFVIFMFLQIPHKNISTDVCGTGYLHFIEVDSELFSV